jgi:hypothetical protein
MVRKPVVSGVFYESDKEKLTNNLKELFKDTKKNDYIGVVSPHAGYMYSGRTSAFAINSLKPSKKFIILGPNHNLLGFEFSTMSSGEWETPLGLCKIDSNLAKGLLKCEVLREDELSHVHEHSIEVQLPFLQYLFRDFEFVPICITNIDFSERFLHKCEALAKTIADVIKKQDVRVIASSDFSHYLPVEIAKEKDEKAFEMIKRLEVKKFFETLEETNASVCGYGPIVVLMAVAKELGLKKVELINKSNSGDATGDYSSVVSYYAIGFR